MGGYHEMLPRMQAGTLRPGQASMARWPETVVEKTLVFLPADFGVNLSLLAAHTARSR